MFIQRSSTTRPSKRLKTFDRGDEYELEYDEPCLDVGSFSLEPLLDLASRWDDNPQDQYDITPFDLEDFFPELLGQRLIHRRDQYVFDIYVRAISLFSIHLSKPIPRAKHFDHSHSTSTRPL